MEMIKEMEKSMENYKFTIRDIVTILEKANVNDKEYFGKLSINDLVYYANDKDSLDELISALDNSIKEQEKISEALKSFRYSLKFPPSQAATIMDNFNTMNDADKKCLVMDFIYEPVFQEQLLEILFSVLNDYKKKCPEYAMIFNALGLEDKIKDLSQQILKKK